MVEGPTLVLDALAASARVTDVYLETGAARAGEVAHAAAAAGATVVGGAPGALRHVLTTVTPQPVAALVRLSDPPLPDALARARGLVVVLAGIGDPGNAGTLVRAAEAAGAAAVLCPTGGVDLHAPKCVRASAGAVLHVPVVTGGDAVEHLTALGPGGWRRVATAADRGRPYDQADLTGRAALVLGNEAHGLDARLEASIDEWVHIPMAGRGESLNVAMAGSVLCFESLRQTRGTPAQGSAASAANSLP